MQSYFAAEAGRGEAMHLFRGIVLGEADSRGSTGGSDQGAFHQAGRGGERVSLFLFKMCRKARQNPYSISSLLVYYLFTLSSTYKDCVQNDMCKTPLARNASCSKRNLEM